MTLDPGSAESLNGLAVAYDRLGDAGAAEATYKKAIAVRPQYWAVYSWLGAFYAGRARYADAAAQFQQVIRLRPDNNRGYYNLGGTYILEGRYDDAIAALSRSIELLPTMSAYSNLGAAYFYCRRYTEAAAMYEKARALDDQDYLNWGNLADAQYWSPEQRKESTQAYTTAIRLARERVRVNPKDATALAYMATYSAMIGDKTAALDELHKALELAPQDSDVMFRAAQVYNHLGDKRETWAWLQKAVAANYSKVMVRDTPDFSSLRADPAFQSLVAGN